MNDHTRIPASSPWGTVQYGTVLADGIISVSTAGHGGVRISPERLAQMPPALRLGRRRWFEEDCEAALVLWAFADTIGERDRRSAFEKAVRDWFPDKWEAHTGRTLEPGESYTRDAQRFAEDHAADFVVTSACGDWHAEVPAGMVGCTAVRRIDGARGWFLVESGRYRARGHNGYVIDQAVDGPWEAGRRAA